MKEIVFVTFRSPWASALPCRSVNLRCWKIALVASAEGGDQVAFDFFRQRSFSEARMLTTTVRLSGCSGLEVLKSLAAARCCSFMAPSTGAATMAPSWPWAAAERMTCSGIMSACCIWGEISLGSVRTDIV